MTGPVVGRDVAKSDTRRGLTNNWSAISFPKTSGHVGRLL
jgi:hypothetical protein